MNVERKAKVILSFDDIDTLRGGCTTHFATKIIKIFLSRGWKLEDFPRLVRLNPDIPWKTRGNASIAIVLSNENYNIYLDDIKNLIHTELVSYISSNYPVAGHSQPTFIVADFDYILLKSEFFKDIYRKAIKSTLNVNVIREKTAKIIEDGIGKRIFIESVLGDRGIVGSLASIGYLFEEGDYTFELLAYKKEDEKAKENGNLNAIYSYFLENEDISTFGNIDTYSKKTIITPHGPDPVLFGLRGDNPLVLVTVFKELQTLYENLIDDWMIFKSNQGTDIHHQNLDHLVENPLYSQIEVLIFKLKKKEVLPSGHYIFKMVTSGYDSLLASDMELACYKEALKMREVLEKIEGECLLLLNGNIRPNLETSTITLNLEKSYVILLKTNLLTVKIICPRCLNLLESMGREKGLRCRKCGYRVQVRDNLKISLNKDLVTTVLHEPPMYQRHLTKPLKRFGREIITKSIESEEIALKIINSYS